MKNVVTKVVLHRITYLEARASPLPELPPRSQPRQRISASRGPDSWHSSARGRPGRRSDPWLTSDRACRRCPEPTNQMAARHRRYTARALDDVC